jgi:SAM-dependent methyltransferase
VLDVFRYAKNWRSYWCDQILPFLGASVLEVGAGTGTVTEQIARYGKGRWVAIEPDVDRFEKILTKLVTAGGLIVERSVGSLSSYSFDVDEFDTLIYSDVIEHIEDDRGELLAASAILRSGGYLCVLVPAHQWLFNRFDEEIGHYRRYSRRSLRDLFGKDFEEVFVRYLDGAGLFASLTNKLALQSKMPSEAQIKTWDGVLVPVSRNLDPLFRFRFGKSLLGVGRKVSPSCPPQ